VKEPVGVQIPVPADEAWGRDDENSGRQDVSRRFHEVSMYYILNAIPLLALLFGIYLTSFYGYLLFHSLSETFSIVIACGIFMVVWNARRLLNNHYLLFVGIAYLYVGSIDFLHMLAFKGMGVFEDYGANLPTQLWVAGRYVEALSLLLATIFLYRRLSHLRAFAAYGIAVGLLLLSIFHWEVFPVCFVEGAGLTPFKIYSEYVICLILLAAIGLLILNSRYFDRKVLILLIASISTAIAQELAFTTYLSVYGPSNMVGHFLKIVSFYLLYKAIIETSLVYPYDLLFRELKQSEAESRKVHDQLQEHALKLQETNKELESFAYTISHDLRAPLRAINGFSRMLSDDCGPSLGVEGKRRLAVIETNAVKMGALIDDLLAFSRAGRAAMNVSRVDMNSLVADVVETLKASHADGKTDIHVDALPAAHGDPALIRQVLANLIENAMKFSRKKPEPRLEVGSFERNGDRVYFVKDNGVGFDMKYHDKLFGVFNRLVSEQEFEGTGVGMAIVRRLVSRHGGRVWAESKPGEGATFFFTLDGKRRRQLSAEFGVRNAEGKKDQGDSPS
jgi:signal transduction histidine kinase